MRLRTLVLIGTGATAVFLLARLSKDESVRASSDGMLKAVEDIKLAVSGPVLSIAELPPVLSGPVRVIDGSTLRYLNPDFTVEIAGIDVCDATQTAYFNGTPWPCGTMATAWLVSLTLGRGVECQRLDHRPNGTIIARCGVEGADIAGEAIVAGHAVTDERSRTGVPFETYLGLEERARQSRVGIWSSTFTDPAEVRRSRLQNRSTEVRHIEIHHDSEPAEIAE